MPLFSSKFFPKKPSPRKTGLPVTDKELGPEKASQKVGLEIAWIKLKLGDQESVFDNGEWVPGNNMRNNNVEPLSCTATDLIMIVIKEKG
jgi:hypothetical protein